MGGGDITELRRRLRGQLRARPNPDGLAAIPSPRRPSAGMHRPPIWHLRGALMRGHLTALIAGFATAGALAYGFERRRGATQSRRETPGRKPFRAGSETLDLNVCTLDELRNLQGLDPALADRIIENRP